MRRASARINQQRAAAAAAPPADANPAPAQNPPAAPIRRPRAAVRRPAAAAAARRPVAAAVGVLAHQIQFALTPYRAKEGILDYVTTEGRKFYDKATASLNEDRYDCKADNLRSFLQDVDRRAQEFGWSDIPNGITQIPIDPLNPNNNDFIDLIMNYGEVAMDHLTAYENTYVHLHTREAQDSAMLYQCLMNSITKEAKDVITIWSDEYHVGGIPSGNLLLRVIIRESHIDTHATEGAIRTRLSNLDTYMATVDHDIAAFNIYVQHQLSALAARGKSSDDILMNLFKGYMACSDKVFHRYMEKKLDAYEEGQDITPSELMAWAKLKYDIIKERQLWNAPSAEEKQILALRYEINELKKAVSKGKRPNNRHKNQNNSKPDDGKPDWMSKEPEKNSKKPRWWKNLPWWRCGTSTGGKCNRYRRHKGEDCRGGAPLPPSHLNHRKLKERHHPVVMPSPMT